jgi:hypothetical protein
MIGSLEMVLVYEAWLVKWRGWFGPEVCVNIRERCRSEDDVNISEERSSEEGTNFSEKMKCGDECFMIYLWSWDRVDSIMDHYYWSWKNSSWIDWVLSSSWVLPESWCSLRSWCSLLQLVLKQINWCWENPLSHIFILLYSYQLYKR